MALNRLLQASAVIALLAAPAAIAAQEVYAPAPAPAAAPVIAPAPAPVPQVLQTPVAEDEAVPSDAAVGDEVDAEDEAPIEEAALDEEYQEEQLSPAEIEKAKDRCQQRHRKAMRRCSIHELDCRSGAKKSLRACVARAEGA